MYGWTGVRRSLLLSSATIFESEEPLFDGNLPSKLPEVLSTVRRLRYISGRQYDYDRIALMPRAKSDTSLLHLALKHTWPLNRVAAVLVRIILAKLLKTPKWVCEILVGR